MSGLLEKFACVVQANPAAIAIVDAGRQYTFAEIENHARRIAMRLDRADGNAVGILLPGSEEYVAALLGIWMSEKTAVPLNPLLSISELSDMIRELELSAVIAARSSEGVLDGINYQYYDAYEPFLTGTLIVMADGLEIGDSIFCSDIPPTAYPNPAMYLYTSGMTGKPKGVVWTHGNIDASVEALEATCAFLKPGTFLNLLPVSQIAAIVAGTLLPLVKGWTIVISDPVIPAEALSLIQRHEIGTVLASPSVYAALAAAEGEFDIHSVCYAISTSEVLPAAVTEAFLNRFHLRIFDGYSQTEAGMVTLNLPLEFKPGSVGKPLHGVEVAIWDEWDNPVPVGQTGEIMVHSESVRERYLHLPVESESTMTTGWLHTGDIGRIDADGFVTIVERKEDLIVSSEGTISPLEIENVLAAHPLVKEAVVFGVKDAHGAQVPKAYVIAREGSTLAAEDLRLLCSDKLACNRVPLKIEVVESLPRTPMGHVWRRLLPEMEQRRREGWRYGH